MDERRRTFMRELERALLEAISESAEVHRTLQRMHREGYTLQLFLDCQPAAADPERAGAVAAEAAKPEIRTLEPSPHSASTATTSPSCGVWASIRPARAAPASRVRDMIHDTPPAPDPLVGLDRIELGERLESLLTKPYQLQQIYDAIYLRGITEFSEMTDLSLALRRALSERFSLGLPDVATQQESADGTTKFLLRLHDGASIETVDIPETTRRTLCISSQAGCGLACAFCVTGYWGAGRNLTAGEIVGQVLLVRKLRDLPESLNLVFMGMGEPLLNLDAVHAALRLLSERISWRRMTVSTAGVMPGIDAIGTWETAAQSGDLAARPRRRPAQRDHADQPHLSARRVGRRTAPLPARGAAPDHHRVHPARRFQRSPADATALAHLLRKLPVKVNLIPFNADPVLGERFARPDDAAITAFQETLIARNLTATVRRTRGDDVGAACGQLRAFARPPRAKPVRRGSASQPT
jgi:23S rRNA (adenine2503-C2)-methyltransferase